MSTKHHAGPIVVALYHYIRSDDNRGFTNSGLLSGVYVSKMIDLQKWASDDFWAFTVFTLKNRWCFTSIRTIVPETDFQITLLHTSHFHVSSKMRFLWRYHFQKIHPPKIAAPSRKFLGENPMKGGLDGVSIALPNFFRGVPISETAFAPKRTWQPKNPLTTPSACVLNFPPKPPSHWPEIRWDRCVPGNGHVAAPPVASQEPRGWRPTGVLEQSNSTKKMTVWIWQKGENVGTLEFRYPQKTFRKCKMLIIHNFHVENWVEWFSKLNCIWFIRFGIPKAPQVRGKMPESEWNYPYFT